MARETRFFTTWPLGITGDERSHPVVRRISDSNKASRKRCIPTSEDIDNIGADNQLPGKICLLLLLENIQVITALPLAGQDVHQNNIPITPMQYLGLPDDNVFAINQKALFLPTLFPLDLFNKVIRGELERNRN